MPFVPLEHWELSTVLVGQQYMTLMATLFDAGQSTLEAQRMDTPRMDSAPEETLLSKSVGAFQATTP